MVIYRTFKISLSYNIIHDICRLSVYLTSTQLHAISKNVIYIISYATYRFQRPIYILYTYFSLYIYRCMLINRGAVNLYIYCVECEGSRRSTDPYKFIFYIQRHGLFVICTDREASELLDRIKLKKNYTTTNV